MTGERWLLIGMTLITVVAVASACWWDPIDRPSGVLMLTTVLIILAIIALVLFILGRVR